MFIAALFVTAQKGKQIKFHVSGMDPQNWYIHTMEYYLALKREEMLIHATTLINLENIMLS